MGLAVMISTDSHCSHQLHIKTGIKLAGVRQSRLFASLFPHKLLPTPRSADTGAAGEIINLEQKRVSTL